MVADVVAAVVAVMLAFLIRFAFDGRAIPPEYMRAYVVTLPLIVPVRLAVYSLYGLYGQIWQHASVREWLSVVWAVSTESVISAVMIQLLPHDGFPRSVIVISWCLKIGFLGAIRLMLRLRHTAAGIGPSAERSESRTLIYGAGDAGAMLVRELEKHPELGAAVVGFIDDNQMKVGYRNAGKPVLGTRRQMAEVVRKFAVTDLIIAMPSAGGAVTREIVREARGLGLRLKTVPGLYELVNGRVSVSQIRDVQIEDVLGREEVKVDLGAVAAYLTDEVVLVTGAGGSIGSELCRQVARFRPSRLVLVGHGENSIYEIDMELRARFPGLNLLPVIADIQDEDRIDRVFARCKPGVVFHAAAHKHVPLMELNPEEAIKNNLFGTLNVARAADRHRAKRFVLISSDKAVNPTSVMGATKRAAEYVIQTLARSSQTVFVAVRFGNVLGSRGSVIPLFRRQIAAGGPVTVTDPQMVRYFMTIPEAARLVIQAASMGRGGEIFVLDMGKPVRIVDLARDLVRLSGLEPDVDIPITYTGMRPGEKLFEELLTAEEGTVATMHDRIFVAQGDALVPADLSALLDQMRELLESGRATNEQIRGFVERVALAHQVRSNAEAGD